MEACRRQWEKHPHDLKTQCPKTSVEAFFPKPSQQKNQEQKSRMIIAESTTNPRGFPYPLLNMQALINSCVNINIPDSLCRLLLPNVNLINICEPKVNLWEFKGVSCKLGGCCLLIAPQSTCQPGMVALTALLGSGMANGYCQISTNLVTSQIMPSQNCSRFSFQISRYDYGLLPLL